MTTTFHDPVAGDYIVPTDIGQFIPAVNNLESFREGTLAALGNLDAGGHRVVGLATGSAGSPATSFTSDADTGFFSPGSDTIAFTVGGTERARLDPTRFTTPVVAGSSAASGNLTLQSTSDSTKGKILFGSASAYDEVNGFLGLGTTSPQQRLDVKGSISLGTATGGAHLVCNDATNAGIWLRFYGDENMYITSEEDIIFRVNGNSGMSSPVIFSRLGRVGIGVTSPDYDLDQLGRVGLGMVNSAPSDGSLKPSQATLYLDETNHKIKFRVRYADGTTLKSGEIALS